LIVFFSLGLLFNVASTSPSNAITARPSTPDHRPRREAPHFSSSQGFTDSSDRDKLDEFVSNNVLDIVDSGVSPSHKRSIVQDTDDETLQSTHKRIKTEPASPVLSSTVMDSTDTNDYDEVVPDLYHNPHTPPVAIAVVLPSQLPSQSLDLGLLPTSVYRSLNVHIWPTIIR